MPSVEYMAFRDGDGCQKCGKLEDLTRDHIWPRSKGGCSCDGNFEILCGNCNLAKGNEHDGRRGHMKADCPQEEMHRFMQMWRLGQREFSRDEVLALVPKLEVIRGRLSSYRCKPMLIEKAHSMLGSIKAFARDFEMIQQQRKDAKPVTLEGLRKTEVKLVEKLGYIREQIVELESGE